MMMSYRGVDPLMSLSFGWLVKAIHQMKNRQAWVAQEHPRAAVAHDRANRLPFICTVAVDRAFGTGWFLNPIRAALDALECILRKGLTILTEGRIAHIMMVMAVHGDHL